MKKPLIAISFMILIIIALSLVRVGVVNSISTTGTDLVALQAEVEKYKKENMLLQENLLSLSSLTNLEKKADTLGFVEAKSHVYLHNPLPLALNQ